VRRWDPRPAGQRVAIIVSGANTALDHGVGIRAPIAVAPPIPPGHNGDTGEKQRIFRESRRQSMPIVISLIPNIGVITGAESDSGATAGNTPAEVRRSWSRR
jgi:hypothetical protein